MKQSLNHLPESNQHQIQRVANTIRNEVDALARLGGSSNS